MRGFSLEMYTGKGKKISQTKTAYSLQRTKTQSCIKNNYFSIIQHQDILPLINQTRTIKKNYLKKKLKHIIDKYYVKADAIKNFTVDFIHKELQIP